MKHLFNSLSKAWLSLLVLATFTSTAFAANTAPTFTSSPSTTATVGTVYKSQAKATDANGDTLVYTIANMPSWAGFSAKSGILTGTPTTAGTYKNISIRVSDGHSLIFLPLFNITVTTTTTNKAPTISGTPSTTAKVGTVYSFTPTATDANGDALVYTITNMPSWAGFSAKSGLLTGTPTTAGTFANISIRVSDGHTLVSLPSFNITVAAATSTNTAPTISGTPSTTAKVGTAYSFKPTAADANGDTLGFSITNKPSWASFNTSTGQLSGTPSSTGTTSNIVIAASDGKVSTSLSAFSIAVSAATTTTGSATLNWTKPTKNTDGSALTDLAGYKIYYGTSSSALSKSVSVTDVNLTSYTLNNLTSGTWYFAISSINSAGVEGPQTTVSTKAI